MADKQISDLIAATEVTAQDLFVLEQSGTAKKLTGQVFTNWLTAYADGHGGIQSIAKTGTSGRTDTYTITFSDETTSTFTVTNGKGILSITPKFASSDSKTNVPSSWSTTPPELTPAYKYLWSTTTYSYNDGTTFDTTPAVIGAYGDTGPRGYTGNTGTPATLDSSSVEYQVSNDGDDVPTGAWSSTVPTPQPGQYLWTRVTLNFNTGTPVVSYSVSRYGVDGTGAVSTVNGVSPDGTGNVELSYSDIGTIDATTWMPSGSNQGRSIKLPNGTLICLSYLVTNLTMTSAWGGMYYTASPVQMPNWPTTFTDNPYVVGSLYGGNDAFMGAINGITGTSAGSFYVYSPVQVSTAKEYKFTLIGIGRWKD